MNSPLTERKVAALEAAGKLDTLTAGFGRFLIQYMLEFQSGKTARLKSSRNKSITSTVSNGAQRGLLSRLSM